MVVQPQHRKECICKGSLNRCDPEDGAPSPQPCTLPNGNGSLCKYAVVPPNCPEPDPNQPRCGADIADDLAVMVSALALATFCSPLRRRLGLPVRRPSRPS